MDKSQGAGILKHNLEVVYMVSVKGSFSVFQISKFQRNL
jgi:hypothetical protein